VQYFVEICRFAICTVDKSKSFRTGILVLVLKKYQDSIEKLHHIEAVQVLPHIYINWYKYNSSLCAMETGEQGVPFSCLFNTRFSWVEGGGGGKLPAPDFPLFYK
jgi:hypothetical protein